MGGAKGATYGGPGGPYAVEHVGAEGDGDDEVFGVSDAHYVARFVLRQPAGARVDSVRPLSANFMMYRGNGVG